MSAKPTGKSGTQSRLFSYLGWVLFVLTLPVLFWALSSNTKSRSIIQRDACISNLKKIDSAKESWAMEFKKRSGEKLDDEALAQHLKAPVSQLQCPAGGRYTVNVIGTNPQCSIAGHNLE